jgi:hypothetical protein
VIDTAGSEQPPARDRPSASVRPARPGDYKVRADLVSDPEFRFNCVQHNWQA